MPEADAAPERLEAPWPRRIQSQFRPLFTPDEEGCDPHEISRAVIAKAHDLGLTPYQAPEPLPPIDEEQVVLVCWTGVEVA